MNITTDILEKFSIYYIAYRMWTPDGKLSLDIDNGPTNDYEWNLHIWTLHMTLHIDITY